jgi:hypothetical protein
MMDIYYCAKETNTNNFVYGTPMCESDDDWWYMPLRGGDVPIDSNTIGRFIGKTDKNGECIFEGDIVAIPSSICDIENKYVVLYSGKLIRYNTSGAELMLQKDGITDTLKLTNTTLNSNKVNILDYMKQFGKSFEMLKELTTLRKRANELISNNM